MKDFLALSGATSGKQLMKAAEDMPKPEVISILGELYDHSMKARATGTGLVATTLVGGIALGELVSYLLKMWGASNGIAAGLIRDNFTKLRTIPHALLGGLLIFLGRHMETRRQVGSLAAGLGLAADSVVHFLDWIQHEGDKTAAEEAAMVSRIEQLEAQVVKLGGAV